MKGLVKELDKNMIAMTPPRGWNSWDCYGPAVTEEALLGNAENMAKHLKEYGWEYVVCDIQWAEPNAGLKNWEYTPFAPLCLDQYGRQIPAENRFPSSANGRGFAPIAEIIHSLGLKFGIHIMRGVPRLAVHKQLPVLGSSTTCDKIADAGSVCKWNTDMYGIDYRREGAQAYYDSIFELYASWGIDFVKVDDIANTNLYADNPYSAEKEVEMIRHAIDKCGRPMVLSLSPGPAVIEKAWHLRKNANMWRLTDDFWDDWRLLKAMFERCEVWQRQVSEGCWPDCDMLPIGKLRMVPDGKGEFTRFTRDEQITLMSLWSIFRAPLIMGGEMRENDEFTLRLLTNAEILKVNSDGRDAEQLFRDEHSAAWKSIDADGSIYVAMFNLGDEAGGVEVSLEADLGISGVYNIRDLWEKKNIGRCSDRITAEINPHGAVLYRLSAIN